MSCENGGCVSDFVQSGRKTYKFHLSLRRFLSCCALPNMYKLRSFLVTTAVIAVVVLLAVRSCDGSDNVFNGCDVPPQFWCSSDQVAKSCQVCLLCGSEVMVPRRGALSIPWSMVEIHELRCHVKIRAFYTSNYRGILVTIYWFQIVEACIRSVGSQLPLNLPPGQLIYCIALKKLHSIHFMSVHRVLLCNIF